MNELIAGVLVAAAALAFVLEPLARHPRRPAGEPSSDAEGDAEKMVAQMRGRLLPRCPACDTPGQSGSVFCSACGSILVK